MPICKLCKLDKPQPEFYSGVPRCKECHKKKVNENYLLKLKDPVWANNERERQRIKERKRRSLGLASIQKGPKKDCRKPANHILGNAIRDKRIIPQPCEVCSKRETQGHHEDYSKGKELDVQWLCTRHHADRHIHLRDRKALGRDPLVIPEWILAMREACASTK